jgi:leader peptidase (prepilin peptidase)/N-methyltransferase
MAVALAAVLGVFVGSFANVLIVRVPSGEQWVRGSSHCPRCGHDLAWHDNLPLVSWLWLRRRCRYCHEPISGRYPLVELVVGALFGLVVLVFGISPLSLGLMFLAVASVALAAIDLEHRRLPDALTLPLYPVLGAVAVAQSWVDGDWGMLLRALAGGLILGGFYFALWFAVPKGMGFGDVKAAGALGLALGSVGWTALAVGAIAGPLIGGVVGVAVMIRERKGRGVYIPYGPWLIAGAWLGVLCGDKIGHAYVSFVTGVLS